MEPSLPLPLDPVPPPEADDKRLWLGNINNKLSEYDLLKIVQKFGVIKKFDFLFHKTGVLKGQPRGYCFVTFETKKQAEEALRVLHGKTVLGKDLIVKWAHTIPAESSSSLSNKKSDSTVIGVESEKEKETEDVIHQIMAIESKLKAMEEQRDRELEVCLAAMPLAADNPLLLQTQEKANSRHRSQNLPYNKFDRKNPHRNRR